MLGRFLQVYCDKMLIFSLNHAEQLVCWRVPHHTGYAKAPPSVIFTYVFCKYLSSEIHTNTYSLQERHKALVAAGAEQAKERRCCPRFTLNLT